MDYEIVAYSVIFRKRNKPIEKRFCEEEKAVEFAKSIRDKSPQIFKIERMVD